MQLVENSVGEARFPQSSDSGIIDNRQRAWKGEGREEAFFFFSFLFNVLARDSRKTRKHPATEPHPSPEDPVSLTFSFNQRLLIIFFLMCS